MDKKEPRTTVAHLKPARVLTEMGMYAAGGAGFVALVTATAQPEMPSDQEIADDALAVCKSTIGRDFSVTVDGDATIIQANGYEQNIADCTQDNYTAGVEQARENFVAGQALSDSAVPEILAVVGITTAVACGVAKRIFDKRSTEISNQSWGRTYLDNGEDLFEYDFGPVYMGGSPRATFSEREGERLIKVPMREAFSRGEEFDETRLINLLRTLDATKVAAARADSWSPDVIPEGKPVKERLPLHIVRERAIGYIHAINAIRRVKADIIAGGDVAPYVPADLYADPEDKTVRPLLQVPEASTITAKTNFAALLDNVVASAAPTPAGLVFR
ncbi:MAG: hypothetical protein GC136_00230 [Alphaproteobacteria bacterium]|nr:hypothetical protein [Alphaproteobacteria bacterium]